MIEMPGVSSSVIQAPVPYMYSTRASQFERIKKMKADNSARPGTAGVAALILSALALAGCANTYGAGTASPASVGQASTVYTGYVESVREVTIRSDRSLLGAATGAVLGGLAGSELGGGDKAQTAGAIGGAVLGGIAGNEAGKALGTSRGYAYTIRFDNGEVREIVQGADIYIAPGAQVNAIAGADGWKVVPR